MADCLPGLRKAAETDKYLFGQKTSADNRTQRNAVQKGKLIAYKFSKVKLRNRLKYVEALTRQAAHQLYLPDTSTYEAAVITTDYKLIDDNIRKATALLTDCGCDSEMRLKQLTNTGETNDTQTSSQENCQ